MDRHADRAAALASLRVRWGAAAPRPGTEVFGALAAAPLPAEAGAADALPARPPDPCPGLPARPPDPRPGRPLPGEPARPALVPLPGGAEPDAARTPAPAGRPLPGEPARAVRGDPDRVIPTGFVALDALLAGGGLPRSGTVTFHGAGSSGATTLALRAVAEAQAAGALVAWVDLARSLDPVDAVARGVRLEWLAVLVPAGVDEALAMAGTLLQGRSVDVLVLDLAAGAGTVATRRRPSSTAPGARTAAAWSGTSTGAMVRAAGGRGDGPAAVAGPSVTLGAGRPEAAGGAPMGPLRGYDRPGRYPGHVPDALGSASARRPSSLVDRLARLTAFARRSGALLLVLEPAEAPAPVRAALAEGATLALELRRSGWVRLGREVVGQRTEVRVAKDRHGAPDRRTTLRLLYAEGGPRDRCLARDELLAEEPVARTAGAARATPPASADPHPAPLVVSTPAREPDRSTDAPPPPRLVPPRAPARPWARPVDPRRRPADPRRAAVG